MSAEPRPHQPDGALDSLKRALRARFPEARFAYRESPDGLRGYLDVATNCEDDFAVLEVVAAATVELYLAHGLQIHVLPFRRLPGEGPSESTSADG